MEVEGERGGGRRRERDSIYIEIESGMELKRKIDE